MSIPLALTNARPVVRVKLVMCRTGTLMGVVARKIERLSDAEMCTPSVIRSAGIPP